CGKRSARVELHRTTSPVSTPTSSRSRTSPRLTTPTPSRMSAPSRSSSDSANNPITAIALGTEAGVWRDHRTGLADPSGLRLSVVIALVALGQSPGARDLNADQLQVGHEVFDDTIGLEQSQVSPGRH